MGRRNQHVSKPQEPAGDGDLDVAAMLTAINADHDKALAEMANFDVDAQLATLKRDIRAQEREQRAAIDAKFRARTGRSLPRRFWRDTTRPKRPTEALAFVFGHYAAMLDVERAAAHLSLPLPLVRGWLDRGRRESDSAFGRFYAEMIRQREELTANLEAVAGQRPTGSRNARNSSDTLAAEESERDLC